MAEATSSESPGDTQNPDASTGKKYLYLNLPKYIHHYLWGVNKCNSSMGKVKR